MQKTDELQRDRLNKEEQARSFELTAMQKAEAEQKAETEQKARLEAEAEKRECDDKGLEELFNEDKVIGAEEIKKNRERSEAERQKKQKMKEAEEREKDRLSREEQMRSFEFTAMQKAEAEQKARLKERKRLWTEHVAANPYGYHANCKNQIEIEEFIDLLFKLKQEREQMRARAERERAEMEREEREAESWNARNERNTIRTEREVRRQVDTRRNME